MHKKIKVLFIIPSLRAGGAERVISYLFNNVKSDRFLCKLIVVGKKEESVYEIHKEDVVFLNRTRVLYSFMSIFKTILTYRPNIVFSAIAHLNIMMGLQSIFFPKTKFIAREVTIKTVSANINGLKRNSRISGMLSNQGYKLLDKIVCQSQDMAKDLIENYNFPDKKIVIINNPISSNMVTKTRIEFGDDKVYKLITVGRLVKIKGHKRILDALARLNLKYEYTIIGDGPELNDIINYSKHLDLYKSIKYISYTNEINEHLANSHLFLQGSFVEGFPNALLESCAVGTPVLAFKCPGGTKEIIEEGINGYSVDSVEEYSEKISDILINLEDWSPNTIAESVYKKYSSERILRQYEELFESTS